MRVGAGAGESVVRLARARSRPTTPPNPKLLRPPRTVVRLLGLLPAAVPADDGGLDTRAHRSRAGQLRHDGEGVGAGGAIKVEPAVALGAPVRGD